MNIYIYIIIAIGIITLLAVYMNIYIIIAIGIIIFLAVLFFGKRQRSFSIPDPRAHNFHGSHDCGIRALITVMPDLDHDEIKDTFMNCTDHWPYKGITDKEFNIGLRHLGIYEKLMFGQDKNSIGALKNDSKSTYIALIGGHFTVVSNGKIVDQNIKSGLDANTKVYSSWKLV